jgi:hypothetical protein
VNVIAGTRKYSASGIGPITGITDIPGESRDARLTYIIQVVPRKALPRSRCLTISPSKLSWGAHLGGALACEPRDMDR